MHIDITHTADNYIEYIHENIDLCSQLCVRYALYKKFTYALYKL